MTTKPEALVEAQVIEAIHACRPLDDGLRKALEDLIRNGEYDGVREAVDNVFPLSELPTWDNEDLEHGGYQCLSDVISEARKNELLHGAMPKPEELLHVARVAVRDRLEDGDYPVWGAYLYRLVGSDGREVWGVVYQQGGPYFLDYEFDGPFLTREQALAAIASFGFTDPEQITIDDVSIMLPYSEDL